MNIAFEISPLITASGTFGDKSGVYRYTIGLLKNMAEYIKKNKLDIKIILFSFNPHFLKVPINPEIYNLIDKKHIVLLRKTHIDKEDEGFLIYVKKLINLKPNIFFKAINKIFFIKKFLLNLSDRLEFIFYLKLLNKEFQKRKVATIFHSETAFFNVGDYKNIITMYDLTPINMPEFHRYETIDLLKRKLRFSLDCVNGIICISESTKNDLIKYSSEFKSKKIIVGYPGLDNIFRQKIVEKDSDSIKNMNLIKNIVIILNTKNTCYITERLNREKTLFILLKYLQIFIKRSKYLRILSLF